MINRPADGGITALHMAALNGHVESLQLLLDLGASVTKVTVEDGTTIDLIGETTSQILPHNSCIIFDLLNALFPCAFSPFPLHIKFFKKRLL